MRNILKLAVIFTLILSLCGCFDYKEIEDSYIVSAVGFDKSGEEFILCLETANNDKNRVFSASGSDFNEAFKNIGKQFAKKAEFSHTACVILGDSLNAEMQKSALEFCRKAENLSLSARVVWTKSAEKLLECEPYEKTVGFDILKILEKNNFKSSHFYEFYEKNEILLPCFEASSKGVILLENRRRYIG